MLSYIARSPPPPAGTEFLVKRQFWDTGECPGTLGNLLSPKEAPPYGGSHWHEHTSTKHTAPPRTLYGAAQHVGTLHVTPLRLLQGSR